jgi:hypothetical protein
MTPYIIYSSSNLLQHFDEAVQRGGQSGELRRRGRRVGGASAGGVGGVLQEVGGLGGGSRRASAAHGVAVHLGMPDMRSTTGRASAE